MPDIVKEAIRLQSKITISDCENVIKCICGNNYFNEQESYLT